MGQDGVIMPAVLALCVIMILPCAQASSFTIMDHFSSFNKSVWYKSTYCNSATCVSSKNVQVQSSHLIMSVPAKQYGGAEVETKQSFRFGTFKFAMKASTNMYVMNAIFLYDPQSKDEVDLEVINERVWEVWFTVYVREVKQFHKEVTLSFDPSKQYHTYAIKWSAGAQGGSSVEFYVDDHLMESTSYSDSNPNLYLVLMAFAPSWTGVKPTKTTYCYVDYVQVSAFVP